MERIVTKIEAMVKELPRRKRVAAYARVSRGTAHMLHSLAAQVKHYTNLIQANSEWEFVGVYADADETGTSDDRPEFQRLITDCRARKIDLVLTKTISRFARNTVTLLSTVRELADLGIEVYFDEQNIYSLSSDGELMLSILASYAQEESRSVSENIKWRIRNDMERGKTKPVKVYGYDVVNGALVIKPDEAKIVQLIYALFFEGLGVTSIAKKLNSDGIASPRGKGWSGVGVHKLIINPKMCGDILHQRCFSENHLSKKRIKNRGELPMFLIEGAHEGIVSKETFEAAKVELARRFGISGVREFEGHSFRKKMFCEKCGENYHRRNVYSKHTGYYQDWRCLGRVNDTTENDSYCDSPLVRERTLLAASAKALQQKEFSCEIFAEKVERIIVHDNFRLTYIFRDGSEIVVGYEKGKRWKEVRILAKSNGNTR